MDQSSELEQAARTLEASGGYKVLRRVDVSSLEGRRVVDGHLVVGLVVDCETTGLDPRRDRIIELAVRQIYASAEGEIVAVGPSCSWLEDPGVALEAGISRITGLMDWDLHGQRIDDEAVTALFACSSFVVAHNAAFDRPAITRRLPAAAGLPWCCSCHDVDWPAKGSRDGRSAGCSPRPAFLYGSSRGGRRRSCRRVVAGEDAVGAHRAGAHAGNSQSAADADCRGWAHFDVKDDLKRRGYGWSQKDRVWRREVDNGSLEEELGWLQDNVYASKFRPMAFGPCLSPTTWQTRYA